MIGGEHVLRLKVCSYHDPIWLHEAAYMVHALVVCMFIAGALGRILVSCC